MKLKEGKRMSHADWLAEGERRFGKDMMKWKFVCPSCGHIASVEAYQAAGAPEGAVAYSCVGRWDGHMEQDAFITKKGPCNYAGGGLIGLNPVTIMMPDGKERNVFDFAETELVVQKAD